ncbi:MAG: low affinity iron permease family protein [Candidatus Saccharimonadales bacterium]
MKETFRKISSRMSVAAGSAYTLLLAIVIVALWAVTGPAFNYSNTWQLVINTGTTIVTFLMVFLIQNTQNRDSKAMQLKLDELLRAGKGRDSFIDIEDMSDEELHWLDEEFKKIHESYGPSNKALYKLHDKIRTAHEVRKHGSLSEGFVEVLSALGGRPPKGK